MQNGGYGYIDQFDIYRAAQATNSAIMTHIYITDPPFSEFVGTDAEPTRVTLPRPTQQCVESRVHGINQCKVNATDLEIFGEALGACDTSPEPLKKVFGKTFRRITVGEDIPEVFKSPALDAVRLYQVTELHYTEIYNLWLERKTDKWGFDFRDATCQWAVNNLELLKTFIPDSHPRVLQEMRSRNPGLLTAAFSIGIITAFAVFVCLALAHVKRKTKLIYYLQAEFINMLLLGMLLVALSAIFLAAPIAEWTCILMPWAANFGFVLQLVPLHARMTAILKLATAGKHMQRVRLKTNKLLLRVAVASCLVLGFLLAWTIVDAPHPTNEYEMTDDRNSDGDLIVRAYDYCGTDHDYWYYVYFGWQALLVVPSCMTAVLAGRVKEDMNDTRDMSKTLHAHLFFLAIHVIVFLTLKDSNSSSLMAYSSIIMSGDTLVALGVYAAPKLCGSGEAIEDEALPDVFVHTTIALMDIQGFAAW